MPTKKRNFTEEFKEEAVRLALTSDQPHHDTALNLGVGKSTLSKWIRQYLTRFNQRWYPKIGQLVKVGLYNGKGQTQWYRDVNLQLSSNQKWRSQRCVRNTL